MGGYLNYFGVLDWYNKLPTAIQHGICDAADCPGDFGFKSEWLFARDISETTLTAVKMLCSFATNALRNKDHDTCDALMAKARLLCITDTERAYCKVISERIDEDKKVYPDQKQIDAYKPVIYNFIMKNPGCLQSDLKKQFSPALENTIGLAYWSLYQEGKVRREKKGRSFQLWIA